MIRAYVDESADEKKRFAYAVAGFVGTDQDWLKLDMLWQDRTAALKGAFHMNECETFHGEFKGWDVSKKEALIRDLIAIINGVTLYGFGASVDIAIFRSVFPNEPDDALYFLCFRHCVSQMAFWGENVGQRVAFVFDQQKEFAHRAHRLYDRLRDTPSNYQRGFGPLAFEDRRRFVPLQVADLIAYETYKIAHHAGHDRTRKVRRSIAALATSNRLFVRYWDEAVLLALRAEMQKCGYVSLVEYMLTAEFMNLIPEIKRRNG